MNAPEEAAPADSPLRENEPSDGAAIQRLLDKPLSIDDLREHTERVARPVELGEPEVIIVLSEVVEQRRVMPNLIGMTHAGAQNAVRQALGPAASGPPVQTPNLIGQPLSALGK